MNLKIKNITAINPHIKTKGKELTEEEKNKIKTNQKWRVGVEYRIGGIKRIFILSYKLRLKNMNSC
ncbi:MAG: hypothetical protein ABI315_14530 [Bacteroidia bacterium]